MPRRLLPLARRAQHHQPRGHAPCSCAVQPAPASAVCPLLPAASAHPSHLSAGLQAAPAAAGAAAAGGEEASPRASKGGRRRVSPPLCSSPPLRSLCSSPLPSPPCAPLRCRTRSPAPPGPPRGATRARPALPRQPAGGPLAPLPAPSHAHLLGVSPSQVPGPSRQRSPGFLAEAGGWVKRRGSAKRQVQGERQYWVDHPSGREEGRGRRQTRGGCRVWVQEGGCRTPPLQEQPQKWVLGGSRVPEKESKAWKELQGSRAEAAGQTQQ